MTKLLAAIAAAKRAIAKVRETIPRIRKALVVAVPALALVLGTDSPTYIKVVAVLVALGVYAVPNGQ